MSPEASPSATLEFQPHRINLLPNPVEQTPEHNKYGLLAKIGRLTGALTIAAASFGAGVKYMESFEQEDRIELAGAISYDNSLIADKALSYVGRNGIEACKQDKFRAGPSGECRSFVNCVVSLVTAGKQNLRGGEEARDYFMPFFKAGGTEITNIQDLAKGDIVQIGKNDDTKIHTFIIVGHKEDNMFDVVDSNSRNSDKMVRAYPRQVSLDANQRAFRMGEVGQAVERIDPNKYKGRIVEWDNGPGKKPTAWLVDGNGQRHWIPDIPTFLCLLRAGVMTYGPQPAKVLDALPDVTGNHASCEEPKPAATQKKFPTTYNAIPRPSPIPAMRHITTAPSPMPTATYASPAPSPQPSPAAPQPSPSPSKRLYPEQQGSRGANTFSNPYNASGFGPRKVTPSEWVDVECKVYAPQTPSANPDGYWYRLYSSPWDSKYYAVANTFMNGDPWGGPYNHNTDYNVPDC